MPRGIDASFSVLPAFCAADGRRQSLKKCHGVTVFGAMPSVVIRDLTDEEYSDFIGLLKAEAEDSWANLVRKIIFKKPSGARAPGVQEGTRIVIRDLSQSEYKRLSKLKKISGEKSWKGFFTKKLLGGR